ncbi:hypothetical protein T484DRAFT_1799751 [Baffinella frigidus]|nr:hypothetical protein T484DRAFT_1799751 [Cryptophyta sp. CCMP2293]
MHPPASHDEFLARRHTDRAPRARSIEMKLTSSFLPAEHNSDPVTTTPHTSMLISADFAGACKHRLRPQDPPASHDDFLARRHAQHFPRVSSLETISETKLTSSFLPANRDSHHQFCDALPSPFHARSRSAPEITRHAEPPIERRRSKSLSSAPVKQLTPLAQLRLMKRAEQLSRIVDARACMKQRLRRSESSA